MGFTGKGGGEIIHISSVSNLFWSFFVKSVMEEDFCGISMLILTFLFVFSPVKVYRSLTVVAGVARVTRVIVE